MTGKEISKLTNEARTITYKIEEEFEKRIKELYVIAQEKGHGTEFGWLEGEVDPDDFETEDEYDEAYEEFCYYKIGFVWQNDHNFIPYDGLSFVIDESGNVVFTTVINVADSEDELFEEEVSVDFYPGVANNWGACEYIIRQIEEELEIE